MEQPFPQKYLFRRSECAALAWLNIQPNCTRSELPDRNDQNINQEYCVGLGYHPELRKAFSPRQPTIVGHITSTRVQSRGDEQVNHHFEILVKLIEDEREEPI